MREVYFGRETGAIPVPNLIESHLKSFKKFKTELIDEVLNEVFPIEDNSGTFVLEYLSSRMEEPNIEPEEAKLKGLTYSGVLKAQMRLINKEIGEIIDNEVFLGEYAYMTEKGTFLVNGNERGVVNQIVRCPGMSVTPDLKNRSKLITKIIPNEGAWISFEFDNKQNLFVQLNGGTTKKIPFTIFLKALAEVTNEDLIQLFGEDNIYLQNSLSKDKTVTVDEAKIELFNMLRPDEPKNIDRAIKHLDVTFFNKRKYNLSPVGRLKLNGKLDLKERLIGKVLAESVQGFEEGYVVDSNFFEKVDLEKIEYVKVLGNDNKVVKVLRHQKSKDLTLTSSDLISVTCYALGLKEGIGKEDDIDHLANRRVRLVGELLQNQFRVGISRVEKSIKEKLNTSQVENNRALVNKNNAEQIYDEEDNESIAPETINKVVEVAKKTITPQTLINVRPLTAAMKEFYGSSQLSQFIEQVNPFAELAHKRRISALGQGGFSKDRAGLEVRDVHYSHYGRMCPSETPEGQNVGLITSLGIYARFNEFGLIETPYVKIDKAKGKATKEIVYMVADEEENYYIAKANTVDEEGNFVEDFVTVRRKGEYPTVHKSEVDFVGVSPGQIVGAGIQLIPFLHHDDANRAVMGANMQRQAVPLVNPDKPIVGTGMEKIIALDTASSYVAEEDGVIEDITETRLIVKYKKLGIKKYKIKTYERTNADTSFVHNIKVYKGEKVTKGQVLVDSSSSVDGELALGKNMLVGFMTWNGFNYEDAVVINQRLVQEDAYTTVMIKEYNVDVTDGTTGMDELRNSDIPQVSKHHLRHLDDEGIVRVGSKVGPGDVLVGKVTPKGQEDSSAEEKLLRQILVDKGKSLKDSSLKIGNEKNGMIGTVVKVVRISKEEGELSSGVEEHIKVFVAEKRKIRRGDKMAGRHGNKGVISIVVPPEDMPFLPDGRQLDIVLNPLGVPSRMNIGQIMETHVGMAGLKLNTNYRIPVFEGNGAEDVDNALKEAGISETGKFKLYDGKTGEPFDNEVTVGVMYFLKLSHQIDDKMHARSTGKYSLVTQQPLGGKAQMGGQRFGEMEVWALEAYGAAYILEEMLTVKSDNVVGRNEMFEAIVKDKEMTISGKTESFKVMLKELQSLGLNVQLIDIESDSDLRHEFG